MQTVEIPQSVDDYFHNKIVGSAVDYLLEQKPESIPSGLTWDEVKAYHRSVASASTVRADYAVFLFDLWAATWGPVLAEVRAEILGPDDDAYDADMAPSPKKVWDDSLYKVATIGNDIRLFTAVHVDEEGAFLWLRVEKKKAGKGRWTPHSVTGLDDPSLWESEPDKYEYRKTAEGLAKPNAANRELDVSGLSKAADLAARAVANEAG